MYHTVRIRDLQPQLPSTAAALKTGHFHQETSVIPPDYWEKSIKKSSDELLPRRHLNNTKYRSMHFQANGPHTHLVNKGHALFEAYLAAYNAHEDLVLSPDDIWLMISIYYAHYVENNAEQMRHLFVDHDGKKELVVDMMTMEPDWPNFLMNMRSEIGKHVKNDVVDLLTSNFSTTDFVEGLLSSMCVMHTFNKYFDYTQRLCGCGIRNVHFLGTLDDWKLLRKKAEDLKLFTLPLSSRYSIYDFRGYLDGILPILDQFIQTYQGNVDNHFWDTIFDYTKVKVAEGSSVTEMDGVRGWFLRLCFGYHSLSDSRGAALSKLSLGAVSVPVKVIDLPKGGKESSCYVVGGFHGIHSSKDGKHRPMMSMAVYEEVKDA